jgi:uncharacterized protein
MSDASPTHDLSIAAQVEADLKDAMRAGDTARRDALRLLRAALKNAEIDRRGGDAASPLQESDVRAVIQRQIKQRRDSIEQFRKGGREDLVSKEEAELTVFQAYLPQGASETEMRAAVEAVIAEMGAQGPKDMGKVMPAALARVGTDADRSALANIVRQLLAR